LGGGGGFAVMWGYDEKYWMLDFSQISVSTYL